MKKEVSMNIMNIGDLSIEQRKPSNPHFKTEYRVWQSVVDVNVFTGEKRSRNAFKGTWNDPKNLFLALAEMSI
jgi:hypothetical protein